MMAIHLRTPALPRGVPRASARARLGMWRKFHHLNSSFLHLSDAGIRRGLAKPPAEVTNLESSGDSFSELHPLRCLVVQACIFYA